MVSVQFSGDREGCNYNLVIFLSYHPLAETTTAVGAGCSLRVAGLNISANTEGIQFHLRSGDLEISKGQLCRKIKVQA